MTTTPFPKVAETALWTAITRAEDAKRSSPVCNDTFASRFADAPRTEVVRDLLALERPSQSIPFRHHLIDELVRAEQAALVVVLGAGLDTRAYRLARDGTRFVEVDHPELLAWKEARLPAAEAPALERIGVDFARETLRARLAHLATDAHVVVVAEGLFMYLTPEDGQAVFDALHALFPDHVVVADIMSARFLASRIGGKVRRTIARHGMDFRNRPASPVAWMERAGYPSVSTVSVIERMQAHEGRRIPRFVRFLLRHVLDGNMICVGRTRPR